MILESEETVVRDIGEVTDLDMMPDGVGRFKILTGTKSRGLVVFSVTGQEAGFLTTNL